MKRKVNFQWKRLIKWFVILIVLLIIGKFAKQRLITRRSVQGTAVVKATTVKAETRDIQKLLSSSGTIEPKSTYEIKTLAEGEIIASDFEEGDYVEEGQILYQIATDNLDSKIETSETAVERANKDYDKATESYTEAEENYIKVKEKYDKASEEYGNPDVIAEESGIVKTLFVKEGDRIQIGTQIAELYDNSSMLLEIPFNSAEVDTGMIGKKAEVTMSDSLETLEGRVTKVSSIEEVLSGNRLVKMVTIEVVNPGGLTSDTVATASIGNIYSSSEGKFKVKTETIVTSKVTGEIRSLTIEEGDKLKKNDIMLVLDQDSLDEQLDTYKKELDSAEDMLQNAKNNIENAEEAIEDAKNTLKETIDLKTDYVVKAPISGQIIKKSVLTGDTISANSPLCTIYDLSTVKFDMFIDELDILSVKEGQKVNITADALEGVKLSGTVTNISLESTADQGVTQYPVTVILDDKGELLPGMNVTGEIILEKAEGILAIPSDALMRGDMVYVKDASVQEAEGNVPAGYRAVRVETGITDGDYIEIKSGLTGEEEIYVVRSSGTDEMNIFMPGKYPNIDIGNSQGMGGFQRTERPAGTGRQKFKSGN